MAKRRRKNKNWISWLMIFVLLVAAIVVCYFVWDAYFKEEVPVEEAETEVIGKPDEVIESDEEEIVKKEEVVQYEGDNPNQLNEITGVVTYAGVSGADLIIRLNLDQFLEGGECMLSLLLAGTTVYNDVAMVGRSASTSTCEGFNVPLSLLEMGHYNIKVEIKSGEKKGEIFGEVNL